MTKASPPATCIQLSISHLSRLQCSPSVVDVEDGSLLAVALVEEVVLEGHALAVLQARQLAHEGRNVRGGLSSQLRDDGALWHQAPRQHVPGLGHIHLHSVTCHGSVRGIP